MKMRFRGALAVSLLSISIISYGFTDMVFGDEHNIPPLLASVDMSSYNYGSMVNVTGSIKDYDPVDDANKAITVVIKSPDGNRVGIAQLNPESDGTFSHSFTAGGPLWRVNGDYTVELRFDSLLVEAIVAYDGHEPAPPPVTCGPNQELRDGVCMDVPPPVPPPITCGPNQELHDGVCMDVPPPITCGQGTELVDGTCVPITTPDEDTSDGGGCLIATAAFGSELASQVQLLREVRDNTVMSTSSGSAFMSGFNQVYYMFSPAVADMERENQIFRDLVRIFITPMLSTLSIMTLADSGSEVQVLGLGISVLLLNLMMYVVAPTLIGFKVHSYLKSSLSFK